MAGCGKYTSKYKAVGFVHSNESSAAFMSFYSFDGKMDSPEWYTCYYATEWYPSYFFHSIIYYQGTWDVLDASMGYNASHGCVRLNTDNALWIYENIPYGTKVVSY